MALLESCIAKPPPLRELENGVFQPVRIWNGDQTDWGLNFNSAPPGPPRLAVHPLIGKT